MSGEIDRLLEQWKAELPGWQRWIFNVLDTLGQYDLGYKLLGFDAWYAKRK